MHIIATCIECGYRFTYDGNPNRATRRLCGKRCIDGRRLRGIAARMAALNEPPDPDAFVTHDLVCPKGHRTVAQTQDGELVDWCPLCRKGYAVPTQGRRVHDQRARLEAEMAILIASQQNPKLKPVKSTRTTTKIVVGKLAA